MSTLSVKLAVPEELKKHTREEQHLAREKKKREADMAKAQKKAEQDSKRLKSTKCITALGNKQMLEDKDHQSLHPNVNMPISLPKVSKQSVTSILASQTAAAVTPSLLAGSASTAPSDNGSPSPLPIPSPQFNLAPALNDVDHDEDGTDGDDLPPVPGIHTSESEGTTDDFGASKGDERGVVSESGRDTAMMDVLDDDLDTGANESSDEYKLPDASLLEALASEPEIDMESLKQLQEFLKLQKAIKLSKKKGSTKKANGDTAQRKAGDGNGMTAMDAKGKKRKWWWNTGLDVCHAIAAERREAPKAAVEHRPDVASTTAKKQKDPGTGDLCVEFQKHTKTELGGLAKDWCNVLIHADSIATSLVDWIEMPAEARVKSESVPKKTATKELFKVCPHLFGGQALMEDEQKTLDIVLKDADMQEIDVKEHGKKSNWKNKDLPFENFVCDLPIWQQKFIPSLVGWATSTIKEPFGMTNHQDFKTTVQDLWTKIFPYLSLKLEDDSAWAEHPAIHAVVAVAVRTHHSDIGKEALKVMDRNWEHEDMKGYLTDEDRSKWNPDKNENCGAFRGRLIMETFAFHLQATMNAPYHYGNLIAGLAITASAVMYLFVVLSDPDAQTTYQGKTRAYFNNPNSFKDDPWGSVANKYFTHMVGYNDNKWREIVLESAKYLNVKKNKVSAVGQDLGRGNTDGILDGDNDITLSP
ncbi:hypothetical protein ARMGADRAFT_1087682 [Armillaria gallica]|uniref:Uncharacterized protein n=1 Tax=Armillaria gallica TaxID=47427 RepID=A0A2H3D372_ARMGA|nr:hypothetical protein ARMGADRAFT_1087682 [Armillaria gallica]